MIPRRFKMKPPTASSPAADPSRRAFLRQATAGATLAMIGRDLPVFAQVSDDADRYPISLHQYSLKPLFDDQTITLATYASFVKRELPLANLEFAEEFCGDLYHDLPQADQLRRESERHQIQNRLFLCGAEPRLDAPIKSERDKAIEHHVRSAGVAARLGCAALRVRAATEGDPQLQLANAADGIGRLKDALREIPVEVWIENITGNSNDPTWLVDLANRIGSDRVGLVADFANFRGDIYDGMQQLLPLTKSVCAKAWDFDASGAETKIDYARMMQIIKESGYAGCIAIEYLGETTPPVEGVAKAAALIRRSV